MSRSLPASENTRIKRKQSVSTSSRASAPVVYYPVFINLSGKKAVVIGGGRVAERKILPLMKSRAQVTVISRNVTKKIEQAIRQKRANHIARQYRKGDLKGAFLVIAATDSPSVNRRVSQDAHCLVNVVDTPDLCNFIVPSNMVSGALNIAVSTGGISPALSRSIRKEIGKVYGREFARYLQILKRIRRDALKMIPDRKKRTGLLKRLASEEMIRILRSKGWKEVKETAEDLLKKAKTGAKRHGQMKGEGHGH